MPTTKNRLSLYLTDQAYAAFCDFCKQYDVSLSKGGELLIQKFLLEFTAPSTVPGEVPTIDKVQEMIDIALSEYQPSTVTDSVPGNVPDREQIQKMISDAVRSEIGTALDVERISIESIISDKLASITADTQSTIKANINGINQRLEVLEDGLKKALRLGYENEALRQKLETLEQQIELVGGLPSSAPSSQPEGITKATLSPIFSEGDRKSDTIPDELLKGLFTAELAKRLGVDSSTVNKHQKRGGKHFATWTKETRADPDGIAWKFGGTRRKPGQKHESKFYVPLTVEEYQQLVGE